MDFKYLNDEDKKRFFPVSHSDGIVSGKHPDKTITEEFDYYAEKEDLDRHAFGAESGSRNILNPNGHIHINGSPYVFFDTGDDSEKIMSFSDNDSSVDLSGINFGWCEKTDFVSDSYKWVIDNGTLQENPSVNISWIYKRCRYAFIYPSTLDAIEKLFKRFKIQIEKGSSASPYEPYIASNAMLTESANASEVRDAELRVLGWNVPSGMSVKNDVVDGVFTQKVGRVDLQTVKPFYVYQRDNEPFYYFNSVLPNTKTTKNVYNSQGLIVSITVAQGFTRLIYRNGTVLADVGEPSGYLYYELAEYKTFTLADYPSTDIKSAELQALGWTVPDEMPIKNSLANGVLTQYVGRIRYGDLTWMYSGNNYFVSSFFIGPKHITNVDVFSGYTSRYIPISLKNLNTGTNERIALQPNSDGISAGFYVRDSSITSLESFVSAVKDEYIYFELQTPITHNITDMPSQKSMISDEWDPNYTGIYYVGDIRIDNNTMYECYVQTDRTSGRPSVDTAHWRKTSVTDVFNDLDVGTYEINITFPTKKQGAYYRGMYNWMNKNVIRNCVINEVYSPGIGSISVSDFTVVSNNKAYIYILADKDDHSGLTLRFNITVS